jgi:L-fuculose-phosphate aldolase
VVVDDADLRREIVDTAHHAEALGLVMHSQGNFSARIPGSERVLITPSGVPYQRLRIEDLVTVDLSGTKLHGSHEPSSETAIHTLAYRMRPWVMACAHVESPYANTLYALNKTIPNVLGNFVYLFGGRGLAVAPSIQSGSADFAERTLDAMGEHFGVAWKNHGIFCIGQSMQLAFDRCVAAEQAARVYYLALALNVGEPDMIPDDVQVSMVETARKAGWGRAI